MALKNTTLKNSDSKPNHHSPHTSYLRVTEILAPFSGIQNIDPEIVANAAYRGTKVHRACESIMSGLGEYYEDDIAPYIESFKTWWGEGRDIIALEKRFYCDDLQITGQVDMILKEDDTLSIVDIKTSYRPNKTWPLQGSAYAYLAQKHGYNINYIKFLHLNKNGKNPKIYEYEMDFNFFLECLRVYKYFFQKAA